MIPLVVDIDRTLADVHWLVEEIGPRAPGSAEEQAAVNGVRDRLTSAGWTIVSGIDSPLACRGEGKRLFLAHIDTVPDSPGALDNAGAVAALLALARHTRANDLCLGFPVAEEAGLAGSREMAARWETLGLSPLELVVAAEFIGDGTPTAIDLWSSWGTSELEWLVRHTDIAIPFRHHVVGRTMPAWRSDHAPFAARGILSFNLLNRNQDAVHTTYHQPSDTSVDPEALRISANVFEQMATAPRIQRGSGDPAFCLGPWVVPGFITWFTIGAGVVSGIAGLPYWRDCMRDLCRTLFVGFWAGLILLVIANIGFPISAAEQTAHDVLGVPTSGWWLAAPWALFAAWTVWLLLWRKLPGQGPASLSAAILCSLALLAGPLMALPFAVSALLVRIHPLFAAGPVLLWLWPPVVREVTFHGLASPWMWPLLLLATWPAFGRRKRKSP